MTPFQLLYHTFPRSYTDREHIVMYITHFEQLFHASLESHTDQEHTSIQMAFIRYLVTHLLSRAPIRNTFQQPWISFNCPFTRLLRLIQIRNIV